MFKTGTSLVVQWLRICLPVWGTGRGLSVVRELRAHMQLGQLSACATAGSLHDQTMVKRGEREEERTVNERVNALRSKFLQVILLLEMVQQILMSYLEYTQCNGTHSYYVNSKLRI